MARRRHKQYGRTLTVPREKLTFLVDYYGNCRKVDDSLGFPRGSTSKWLRGACRITEVNRNLVLADYAIRMMKPAQAAEPKVGAKPSVVNKFEAMNDALRAVAERLTRIERTVGALAEAWVVA